MSGVWNIQSLSQTSSAWCQDYLCSWCIQIHYWQGVDLGNLDMLLMMVIFIRPFYKYTSLNVGLDIYLFSWFSWKIITNKPGLNQLPRFDCSDSGQTHNHPTYPPIVGSLGSDWPGASSNILLCYYELGSYQQNEYVIWYCSE